MNTEILRILIVHLELIKDKIDEGTPPQELHPYVDSCLDIIDCLLTCDEAEANTGWAE